jgi:hypothetical protein
LFCFFCFFFVFFFVFLNFLRNVPISTPFDTRQLLESGLFSEEDRIDHAPVVVSAWLLACSPFAGSLRVRYFRHSAPQISIRLSSSAKFYFLYRQIRVMKMNGFRSPKIFRDVKEKNKSFSSRVFKDTCPQLFAFPGGIRLAVEVACHVSPRFTNCTPEKPSNQYQPNLFWIWSQFKKRKRMEPICIKNSYKRSSCGIVKVAHSPLSWSPLGTNFQWIASDTWVFQCIENVLELPRALCDECGKTGYCFTFYARGLQALGSATTVVPWKLWFSNEHQS